jgi:subtilase family serine protease
VDRDLGSVISQSFGQAESCDNVLPEQHQVFQEATRKHITLLASSGDRGAALPTCAHDGTYFQSVSSPASDPLVTGVGGTHLVAEAQTGAYEQETNWYGPSGASGGGYSTIYKRPFYQQSVTQSNYRGIPDVSYDADPSSGVLVVSSSGADGLMTIDIDGGTSIGAPQWAAIVALGNQLSGQRLGCLNGAFYRIGESPLYSSAFHDLTVGQNSFPTDSGVIQGYDAAPGWDPVSGWGTPNVAKLLPLLTSHIFPDDTSGL